MKLVKGAGSAKTGACWMSAIHYYTRNDSVSWSDQPDCVSPIIRRLCIRLNDICSEGEREALIGPHLLAPVGTNTGRCEDEIARCWLIADQAVRVWAPRALRFRKREDLAKRLEALAPITNRITALAAAEEARKIRAAAAYAAAAASVCAAYATDAAAAAAAAAAYADAAADAYAAAAAYADAYAAAAAYADADDDATDAAEKRRIKEDLLDLILRCCEIGERVEPVKACSVDTLTACLEGKESFR